VYLVTCDYFRSRDEDGGHTIRSAIIENPMLHSKSHDFVCYRTGVMVDQSFTLQI